MKKCSKCKIEKEETEFWVRKNSKLGINSECKQCCSQRRRNADKTKVNARQREWNRKNPECSRRCALEYQKKNKDKVNEAHRNWWNKNGHKYSDRRKKKYLNLTLEKKDKIKELARKNNKIYIKKHPEKIKARSIIYRMIKRGWLSRPTSCNKCGINEKTEAHHADYSKPLDVIWVCKKCHVAIHKDLEQRKK